MTAEQVTSMVIRSWRDSETSIAVTSPPASDTAVASRPTTEESGTAYRRTVIEYEAEVGVGRGRLESGIAIGPSCQTPVRPGYQV